MGYLALLVAYSAAQIVLGLWIGRRVQTSKDFFVAGRRLGPGLMFATMLAANIGAGSTVGATALGYRDGLAAVWWVGSAALGSVALALWIGPAIRRIAAARDFRTVGDFLEFRFGVTVRTAIAALLWVGAVFILAGQLIAIATILNAIVGAPPALGCAVGGLLITIYFTAGGLVTSAYVNVVQLTVKLLGFAVALPLALAAAGGWSAVRALQPTPDYWDLWQGGHSGVIYLAALGPAFVVSPGLLQKIYGARDDHAVRLGVGANAVGLALYAFVPVLMGMIARLQFPDLATPQLALPTLLLHGVPAAVGAIGLAAVFSAELSAADAVLFMLTTSLSQDFYKRFVNPAASDAQVLLVTRITAVIGGGLGVVVAIIAADVVSALSIFYTLMAVGLFVPILAGLFSRRASPSGALAAIVAGVGIVAGLQLGNGGASVAGFTPAMIGLLGAVGAYVVVGIRSQEPGARSWVEFKIQASEVRSQKLAKAESPKPVFTEIPMHKIAILPGDGIGQEVVPAALDVIERAAPGLLAPTTFPWGSDFYQRHGRMMAADGFDQLQQFEAIFLGAIGDPRVPDHVSVWELILPLRQRFDLYVNLRPMRLMPGVTGPLAGRGAKDIDMVCVRENSEGEYAGLGGRLHVGTPHEVAEQTGIFTRRGIERIARYAFETAARRPRRKLASATKSNALQHSMVLWDSVVDGVAKDYPTVEWRKYHVDALAARMITDPGSIDVILASNLFGDILTDLGAAISGSLGVAPSANLNPERKFPSMFEPIHGSAPDIAGKGIANPIGAIWAGALMLSHLGHQDAHDRIVRAIERVLGEGGPRTPDLGGKASTKEVATAVAGALEDGL